MNTDQITLKFSLLSTDYSIPLGIKVCLDGNTIYESSHLNSEQQLEYQLSDAEAEHNLSFEMFGKKPEHTKINESGEILSDAMLSITNIEIDGIDINQIVQSFAVYHHDFNGTKDPVEDKFYKYLGCNGTLNLNFRTPVYLWILENM